MRLQFPVVLPLLSALTTLGCFGELPGEGETGSAVAELQTVPAGVGCLRIVYRVPGATADTTRNLAVTPGAASSFDLGYLAPGTYAFRPSAYNVACGSVTGSTVASWVGDATNATITAGYQTRVTLTLRPNVTTPGTVDFIQPVRAIFSGNESNSTYAIMQDGTLRAWGNNRDGQLGNGSTLSTLVPRVLSGLSNVTQIAAGERYACATSSSGLACWGNFGGLLADDLSGTSLTPRVNPDVEPLSIVTGNNTMCGDMGSAWRCWTNIANLNAGATYTGQSFVLRSDDFPMTLFGDPPRERPLLAIDNGGILNAYSAMTGDLVSLFFAWGASTVAATTTSYCVVYVGGDVVCRGRGPYGELGDGALGTATNHTVGVRPTVNQVTSLVGGAWHYCALRRDRTVWCWGSNGEGQIGADLPNSFLAPSQVAISDVVQIASGQRHTCALKADGTVWCWGLNEAGQLGDGTNITRFAPVRVQL